MPLAPDREANDTPAYLLGRLWAVLHDLETAATGDSLGVIGYGKWSATIANPIAALTHYGAHAAKWELRLRRKGHVRIADQLAERIAPLIARISTPERPTGSEASSWFILGYWHQRAAHRRDRIHPPEVAEGIDA